MDDPYVKMETGIPLISSKFGSSFPQFNINWRIVKAEVFADLAFGRSEVLHVNSWVWNSG